MQQELIETFLDLVESRNFRRTAERLGVTQSTVSARVRTLEEAVGSQLFTRGRGGAEPTPAGARFVSYARSIRISWALARQELGALDRFEGVLRIAAQVSLIDQLLFEWVSWLRNALPKVAIHVEADYSTQMIADLGSGNLDIGVIYTPQFLPDILYEQILSELFELVSTETDRLESIHPAGYIRVGYSPAFEKAHSELLPHLARAPLSAGLGTMAAGFLRLYGGAAYLPRQLADALVSDGAVRRVVDAPKIAQPVFAACHVRRKHDPQIRKALKALKIIASEDEGSG